VAPNDPPSPQALATLHYLQDEANYIRSYPATSSEAVRLISYFLRRLIGWDVSWPVPQISGWPTTPAVVEAVAGVTSLQPDALAVLTGAIRLLSGANITLSEAGQDITITGAAPGISSLVLFDQTLGADAASIDTGAGGIAGTAAGLLVHIVARTSQAVVVSSVNVRLNNDSGANYDYTRTGVVNTTLSGATTLAATSWALVCAGDSVQAGSASFLTFVIPAYADTTFHKVAQQSEYISDSSAANNQLQTRGLRWRSTAAISRMSVAAGSGNLRAGSRMTVYGLL
jgi:hypothetical protein